MKKICRAFLALGLVLTLSACATSDTPEKAQETQKTGATDSADSVDTSPKIKEAQNTTLVYASGDYTRINPALDEHGEINILIFNGLTAHDGEGRVVSALADTWEIEDDYKEYTFHLLKDVKWHDGEPFTAEDVKFTYEAIMDPKNESENAANYEDVESISVVDDYTVKFRLKASNTAFEDYMTMPILPKHLLDGEDFQTSAFFRAPVGTGPYKLESWDEGQAITLVRNEDYFGNEPVIDTIVFKIVEDDSARMLQMQSGELDLAHLTPKDSESFKGKDGYNVYNMTTADYRGIMFNFQNKYWTENKDIIPAICYGLDRQAMVDSILIGHGEVAYSPLQRNEFNNENIEKYEYNPTKAKKILEDAGAKLGEDGYYYRNGEKLAFTINVMSGDQVRLDLAQAAAQQLKEIGIEVKTEVPESVDWASQMAFLIGWGSPFDADDHTYKIFSTGKEANYNGYSNENVDKYLLQARQKDSPEQRKIAYGKFLEELASDPPYAFICYVDADYVSKNTIHGIKENTVLGHHGVGIFWNVTEWTID